MTTPTVFDLMANATREAGIRVILIGGFAVNAYGVSRNTKDVDFLIRETDYPKFRALILARGCHEAVLNDLFVRLENSKNPSSMPIDLLFIDDRTFAMIWDRGREVTLAGQCFRTPSLQHLIALKLHALKQGSPQRELKDLADIVNLIAENPIDPGTADFKELCRKFGPPGILNKILEKCGRDEHG